MNTKKLIFIIAIISAIICICSTKVFAEESTNYVSLSDEKITLNGDTITTDSSKGIYLTNSMNNGGTSEDATSANIEISNIINISSSGVYEFTGNLSDGQIAINSNKINGDVTIILNNANITCEKAPAIFVYNSNNDSSNCTITIKTAKETSNTIAGGKIKQSVEEWIDQDKLLYYIEKGYDDDRQYYERYKYDGAISSDISLTFEGEGTLIVNAIEKEGIESKRDITINSGNYIINSLDDGINASKDKESVITINDGTILVNVQEDAEEGDGIDSNGYIYINGGKIYAFASEKSQDSGLDSDSGIYINGGYVVGTGNMADEISNSSKQEFMQLQFTSKVSQDTLITITDENNNPVVAFKTDRAYSVLTISTPDIKEGEHHVYEGGKIEGTSENGLYTKISSYEEGTIKEYNNSTNRGMPNEFEKGIMNNSQGEKNYNVYYYTIIGLGIALVIIVIVIIAVKKTRSSKISMLVIGMLIGAIIATGAFYLYEKSNEREEQENMENRPEMLEEQINMKDRMEMPEKQINLPTTMME